MSCHQLYPSSTHSDSLGKVDDGKLVRRANVDGAGFGTVHKKDQSIDQVVDVLERSGLLAVTVNSHILTLERLDDKVRDNSAVVRVHSGTECVEDTSNTDLDIVLSHVAISEGLGNSLALVVAGSGTDTVDMAPVLLTLRVLFGVAVDLGRRGDEESRLGSLGKTQHIECTHERGLDGLDRVVLVVGRRGRASKMVDF